MPWSLDQLWARMCKAVACDAYDHDLCAECRLPLLDDECANERGEPSGVHAGCWAAWCAGEASRSEDERVDRAQERELWRAWGGAS